MGRHLRVEGACTVTSLYSGRWKDECLPLPMCRTADGGDSMEHALHGACLCGESDTR